MKLTIIAIGGGIRCRNGSIGTSSSIVWPRRCGVTKSLSVWRVRRFQRLAEQYLHKSGELETICIAELRRRLATDDVVLVDVRPELEYQAGHIPGALSVPEAKLATFLRMLPHDKEIVAYCRGPFCFFSHEAVLRLKKEGFNARRLNCGLPDWRFAGLPIEIGQSK